MSYFAAAVVGESGDWTAVEVNLSGVSDIEEVADRLRDVDPDARVSLLFVEAEDTYLSILRLDEGDDLRVFASDSAFATESRLGALLVGDMEAPTVQIDEVERTGSDGGDDEADDQAPNRPVADPDADPVGDVELLADLGFPAQRLLSLCAHEGLMPADVTAEICQALGCVDELEELRGA